MLLSRQLASGLTAAVLKHQIRTAVAHWAMPKRAATGSPSSATPGPSTSPSTAAAMGSLAKHSAQPPNKRRRVMASAVPQTATAAPKTAQAVTPAAGGKPAAAGAAKAAAPKPAASKVDENGMWMIVGLGNPGSNYDDTRHNVGFKVIDELASAAGIDCRKLEKSAAVGKGELQGKQVLLVKPVTFMNNSGESVAALAKFYRVPPGRVLVVADDLDQPTAQVRLRQRGGHGGHNGLRSIIDRMGGTQDFPRIKIGIGRPAGPIPIASYVLQPFSKAERPEIDTAVQESIIMIKSVLALGLEKAASGQRI